MCRLFPNWAVFMLLLTGLCGNGYANPWQVSGFITQGLTYSSDNHFLGDSDDGVSTDFTEAGLNGSRYLNDKFRFVSQLSYRNNSSIVDKGFDVDLLLLDILLSSSGKWEVGSRLGRITFNTSLYSDVADIASVWPSALLHEAGYASAVRSTFIYVDGLELYIQREIGGWTLDGAGQIGVKTLDKELQESFTVDQGVTEKDSETDELFTLRFQLSSPGDIAKLGVNYIYVDWERESSYQEQLTNRTQMHYEETRLYLQYQWQRWQMDMEYSEGHSRQNVIEVGFPNGPGACDSLCLNQTSLSFLTGEEKGDVTSWYLMLYRYFPGGFSLYGGYGESFDSDDIRGKQTQALTGLPAQIAYMKQLMLGFRYDIDHHWRVAGLVSLFDGTNNLDFQSNPPNESLAKHWHVVHLNLSYTF